MAPDKGGHPKVLLTMARAVNQPVQDTLNSGPSFWSCPQALWPEPTWVYCSALLHPQSDLRVPGLCFVLETLIL